MKRFFKTYWPFFAALFCLASIVYVGYLKREPIKTTEKVEIQSMQVGACEINIGRTKSFTFVASPNCHVGIQ